MTKAISHFWEELAALCQNVAICNGHVERDQRGLPRAWPQSLGDISSGVYLKFSLPLHCGPEVTPNPPQPCRYKAGACVGGEGVLQQTGQ